MITLFHTTRSTPEIQRVQVERQTTKTVVIDGRRRDKRGSWGNYYDTWEEAKDSMSNSARGRVALCRAQLVEQKSFCPKSNYYSLSLRLNTTRLYRSRIEPNAFTPHMGG
jgi:hypothetical protein